MPKKKLPTTMKNLRDQIFGLELLLQDRRFENKNPIIKRSKTHFDIEYVIEKLKAIRKGNMIFHPLVVEAVKAAKKELKIKNVKIYL